jgi:hypothetical protein
MPQAKKEGNRWLLSWCHEVLLERGAAAEALVMPLDGVKTWMQDDPNTLLLYRMLRKQPSSYEYVAVLRGARILRRMGQWLLALDLVRSWEFKSEVRQEPRVNGVAEEVTEELEVEAAQSDGVISHAPAEPPSLLDSFSEPEAVAVVDEQAARQAKAAELLKKLKTKKEAAAINPVSEKPKPPPTQFKEPDANSLLDAFGF